MSPWQPMMRGGEGAWVFMILLFQLYKTKIRGTWLPQEHATGSPDVKDRILPTLARSLILPCLN